MDSTIPQTQDSPAAPSSQPQPSASMPPYQPSNWTPPPQGPNKPAPIRFPYQPPTSKRIDRDVLILIAVVVIGIFALYYTGVIGAIISPHTGSSSGNSSNNTSPQNNSNSNVTTPSSGNFYASGFSPFTVTSSYCTDSQLVMTLVNEAGTAVTWINETVTDGTGINVDLPGTPTYGTTFFNSTQILTFLGAGCLSNIPYNASLTIWYNITNSEGLQNLSAVGTVAGTGS